MIIISYFKNIMFAHVITMLHIYMVPHVHDLYIPVLTLESRFEETVRYLYWFPDYCFQA